MQPSTGDTKGHFDAGQSHEDLVAEIQRLREELLKRDLDAQAARGRRFRLGLSTARVGLRTLGGSQLYQKMVDLWDAWSAWMRSGGTAPLPEAPTRDFSAALLARFARTGFFFFLFATLPVVLVLVQLVVLVRQNELVEQQTVVLDNQTELISQQTQLTESARRSALAFEQSAILDKIDEEMDLLSVDDNPQVLARLSPRLQGRIVALSASLRPYRYLDGDTLTTVVRSPERGQLLLALLHSKVDMSELIGPANFAYADLPRASLRGFALGRDIPPPDTMMNAAPTNEHHGISLPWVNLWASELHAGSFKHAYLVGANFREANLIAVDLRGADLSDADFSAANLEAVDLRDTFLDGVTFKGATLSFVEISPRLERGINWRDLAAQMCSAKALVSVFMADSLLAEMQKDGPCAQRLRLHEEVNQPGQMRM